MSCQRDVDKVIREALGRGWEIMRQTGGGHRILRWPPTNRRTAVPTSVSDHRAVKNLTAQLRRMESGATY